MTAFTLTLLSSGVTLTESEIRYGNWPQHLNGYERQALLFCHDWLNGKESFVLHTSGSTGIPKPIVLTRQQMAASARMTGKALHLQAGDRALVNLNVQYIAGIMMLVRGMELTLELTVTEPSAEPLSTFPAETRFDFLSFVPLQLERILTAEPGKLDILQHAKAIIIGGAPLIGTLEDALQIIEAPVFQTYGMTETVSHIALRRLTGTKRTDYYAILEGVQIETDSRSCLVIRAPALNDQVVVTNDVVEMLTATTFRWLGRADNIINSGGIKVQAEKVEKVVEAALQELEVTNRFFVAGLPHPSLGEAVTLFVEGTSLKREIEDRLRVELNRQLSRYEIPKTIHYLVIFPQTPTGKIDRRAVVTSWQTNQTPTDKNLADL